MSSISKCSGKNLSLFWAGKNLVVGQMWLPGHSLEESGLENWFYLPVPLVWNQHSGLEANTSGLDQVCKGGRFDSRGGC